MYPNDMYPDDGHEPMLDPRPNRWWVWVALVLTAIAIPVVVIDNLPDEEGTTESQVTGVEAVQPSQAPSDRPDTGPPKGVSVVTSSTTSSTLPITITTTTLPS